MKYPNPYRSPYKLCFPYKPEKSHRIFFELKLGEDDYEEKIPLSKIEESKLILEKTIRESCAYFDSKFFYINKSYDGCFFLGWERYIVNEDYEKDVEIYNSLMKSYDERRKNLNSIVVGPDEDDDQYRCPICSHYFKTMDENHPEFQFLEKKDKDVKFCPNEQCLWFNSPLDCLYGHAPGRWEEKLCFRYPYIQ